jgi:DNA-binding NtrC family response regulator
MDKQSDKSMHALVVDDDPDILTAARLLLKRHFASVTLCGNPKEIPDLLERKTFDVILLDMNFGPGESSGEQGFYWLGQILAIEPQAVVIMITAHGGVNIAVEAMKQGATDFIAKPWQNQKVIATVNSAKKLRASQLELKQVSLAKQGLVSASQSSADGENNILGKSHALKRVLDMLSRAAPTDANVLILGENGTGKELIARELHRQSHRSDQVFMSVDVGSLSATLFESELFGHRKGAFTGANSDRVGRILAANGGTLFLDEIGNLPLHLQAKLLTVLAQRQVTPLGDNKPQSFDVRIVAATNLSKIKLSDENQFRQDLLFRLNTVELELPPLRERREDIMPIAEHYLAFYGRKYQKNIAGISTEGKQAIKQYDWPGNIRALRHAMERAVILGGDHELTAADFQLSGVAPVPAVNTAPAQASSAEPAGFSSASVESNAPNDDKDLNLDRIEKETIAQALRLHKYNISHASKALGLTRAALYRRMEKHGL